MRAYRLTPTAQLPGLQPVALYGEIKFDPADEDFFRAVVEHRHRLLLLLRAYYKIQRPVVRRPRHSGCSKALSSPLRYSPLGLSLGPFASVIRPKPPTASPSVARKSAC